MSLWVNSVPRVEDGKTTFSADSLNPIIDALTDRTDYLLTCLNGLSGKQGYILPDKGFSASCVKGTLVAINPQTGIYEPAEAKWSDSVRADGSWAASYSSSVVGVLTNNPVDNGGTGLILCEGWTTDVDLVDILAPERVVGDYYLTENGKATCDNQEARDIRVYCYSYLASGKLFINPAKAEYAGHSHNYATVDVPWVSVNQLAGSHPTGAVVAADINKSLKLKTILKSNPGNVCIVVNGEEADPSKWAIADTYVYLMFQPLVSDVITIHAITPLLGDEPIVRSIRATNDNKLISVTSVGGKVWLGLNDSAIEENNYSGKGITSITSDGLKIGPVIQGIKAGPGINVDSYIDNGDTVPGVVVLSSAQYKGTLIDMSLCNLNNVLIGTSFYGVSYVFPANSGASLTGTMRIPHFDSVGGQRGELVLVFQGNGSIINGLEARVLVQSLPTPGNASGAPIQSTVTHTVPSINGSDVGKCYSVVIPLGGDKQALHSDGLLICQLESSSSAEISLVSMSLRLV